MNKGEKETMIEIKNFSKIYNKEKKAVDNISLKINDGEIFAFIGHNGAGKTTTIKSIAGILDFEQGDILINGKSIKKGRKKRGERLKKERRNKKFSCQNAPRVV